MGKKEFYRRTLPHFQQPGQIYFMTWNLKDAVPPKALARYTNKLNELKAQIEFLVKEKNGNGKNNPIKWKTGWPELWQKESFDTTIRDNYHLYNAVRYTLQNPVSAGLVSDWKEWPGTWISSEWAGI